VRIITLERRNVVAQELCSFWARMGNERFGLRKFQLEAFLEERSKLPFDLLNFLFGANKAQQKIVGVT